MADDTPFDDIRQLVAGMPPLGGEALPVRVTSGESLGRLEPLAAWAGAVQGKAEPGADRALVCLFAASHGLVGGGDALEATRRRLESFAAGTAPINAVCAAGLLGFKAFDLALDMPTGDIARGDAMDERSAVATMAFGMEAVAGGADLLGIGSVSEGGEVVAGAMLAALYGDPLERWIDPLAGDAARTLLAAPARGSTSARDPLTVLARFGGRDIAAMAGAILAARHQRVPVVLDGFASCAAAAILQALHPGALDHCLAGHISPHPAHADLVGRLGLEPLLIGLAIEAPGVGAALGLGLLKAATAIARRPA